MSREHYIQTCLLESERHYFIYIDDESDGFVTDRDGFVLGFKSVAELRDFAESNGIEIIDEMPATLDLNIVKDWLNGETEKIEDYNDFLNAWNMFGDFSASVGGDFDSDRDLTNSIYEKIFWGCNIPAVTPAGKSYTPEWSADELQIIRQIMTSGLAMYREKTRIIHNP